jgi:predicted amidophosphoribosyltransferase
MACALAPAEPVGPVRAAFAYDGAGRELLRRFKFEGRRDALAVISERLAGPLDGLRFDGIVPLPRHARRVRELGSDPVYELAREVARRTGAPLWGRLLWRTRPTPPQTGLSPSGRRANVAGSFGARRGALRGRTPLLLDDVVTTGATLAEAARVLEAVARSRPALRLAAAATPSLSRSHRAAL